jgi:hypothetical protein
VIPGVGADDALVGDALQVLPLDGFQGQGLADGGLGLWVPVFPVLPHRFPEGLGEAGFVAVAVLGDDRRYRVRVAEGQPPTHGRAIVMDVDGVPPDSELPQQTRGQAGESVEGVLELLGGRRVGQAEAQVVRSDHVIPVRQQRDQVAEHERAGREPM